MFARLRRNATKIGIVTVGVGVAYLFYRRRTNRSGRNLWKDEYEKDTVYLHVFPREMAKCVPNSSPYAMKLETWLRINRISYKLVDTMEMSEKKQTPFILFNGEEIPDTNFIIEYLSKHFHVDSGLSDQDAAVARAFKVMMEENTKWTIFWCQAVDHPEEYGKYVRFPGPDFVKRMMMSKYYTKPVKKTTWYSGIGRHSTDEIYKIGCDDIKAVSDFLGDKEYIFGDKPTLVDCTVFAFLVQLAYVPVDCPQRKAILSSPNLMSYLERMKTNYWKDWDEQFI